MPLMRRRIDFDSGDSEERFQREIERRRRQLQLESLRMPRSLFADSIAIASMVLLQIDAWLYSQILPGLGIQSCGGQIFQ